METLSEFEDQKRLVRELLDRLVDVENKLMEGEMLRKKLHNTILVIPLLHMHYINCCGVVTHWAFCNTGIKREHSCIL